jgi:hypothetical protein
MIRLAHPGTIADLAAGAGGLPVYMSGPFDIAQPVVSTIRGWFARHALGFELDISERTVAALVGDGWRKAPAAPPELIHARDLWVDMDDWGRRWPSERVRFGAMLLITVAEASGKHVTGEAAATEIEAFLRSGRPVGWLAIEPTAAPTAATPRLKFHSRFAVEGFRQIDLVRFAGVWPAVDAEPFRPVFATFAVRHDRPHLSVV